MARPQRARRATAVVLDSEGLSQAASGNLRAKAWIQRAHELRLPLVVNAVTLTETVRGSPRDAPIHLLRRRARVDVVDVDLATEAGALLGSTRRSDTVDALVAVSAIRLRQPVTILTSDPDDQRALTAGHPEIRVAAV